MPPILKFLLRRFMAIPITLVIITMVLYGIAMLSPAETRAELYMPKGQSNNPNLNVERIRQNIIDEYGLNDPYLNQYFRWAAHVFQGDWGWSPSMRDYVLPALLKRTPATAELTLYSVVFMIPLGIISGVYAGWKRNQPTDILFRLTAFIATSIPSFILGLVLLGIFYASLQWFPPGRIDFSLGFDIGEPAFRSFTGLLTLDGILNGRLDITMDAFRHLILPATTLSLAHWASLGRITRQSVIEEVGKDYINTARGKGLPGRVVVWVHALKNAIVPALNSTALSAASLITGVFVVEVIFGFNGVSEMIVSGYSWTADTALGLGFAVYAVFLVLPIMFILDILQGVVDPRIREGMGAL